jgi:hypothetical protein
VVLTWGYRAAVSSSFPPSAAQPISWLLRQSSLTEWLQQVWERGKSSTPGPHQVDGHYYLVQFDRALPWFESESAEPHDSLMPNKAGSRALLSAESPRGQTELARCLEVEFPSPCDGSELESGRSVFGGLGTGEDLGTLQRNAISTAKLSPKDWGLFIGEPQRRKHQSTLVVRLYPSALIGSSWENP